MKENLGWKLEPDFYVPDEVYRNMDEYIKEGQAKEESWNNLFKEYKNAYPELASEYEEWMSGKVNCIHLIHLVHQDLQTSYLNNLDLLLKML